MKQIGIVAIILVVCIAVLSFFLVKPEKQSEQIQTKDSPTIQENQTTEESMKQPKMTINTSKNYTATLATEKGDIIIELNAKDTPVTVNNFVALAKKGFYDGLTFHRVIPNFMVQGGCPNGIGNGGPGYKINCELTGENQYHDRGVISMAHAGRNTGGSQFFICHNRDNTKHLDRNHTVFGKVVENVDIVDKIRQGDQIEKVVLVE